MGLIEFVIKEISPKIILVPILMTMEIPITRRNSNGSSHDAVDNTNMRITTGNKIANAFTTVDAVVSWINTKAGASPVSALSLPIR